MTYAERLFRAYPNVTTATAFVEAILCGQCREPGDDGETSWDIIMGAVPPVSPDEALAVIRECMEDCPEIRKSREALAQTYHPEFLAYLRGKMGAV